MLLPLALLVLLQAPAPEPSPKPVLENNGKPMRVPFRCSDEDIRLSGLICPPRQPCPVYLELANLEAVGNKLFLTGNLHTESATLYSILLASEDEGKTWSEPFERLRAAGLDQVQFFDFSTGWISGQTLAAVPRDPFLLLTRDGGKSWHQSRLWDESREGMVEAFRFESRTHGRLWVDRSQSGETGARHEAYESMTGGESWSLREASDRPPRKVERPSAPAGWRLRADSRSFRVERNSGEGWRLVASFLIHTGDCKEPEITLPAPPPTDEPKPAEPAPPPTLKKKPGS